MPDHIQQIMPSARKVQNFTATPEQLADDCLAEARNNPERAITLAGIYAHGGRWRATVVASGHAFLHGKGATDAH
jgi:hypothetical protein